MEDWELTKIEKDSLGGPDIAHFTDGYRLPIKLRPQDLLLQDQEFIIGLTNPCSGQFNSKSGKCNKCHAVDIKRRGLLHNSGNHQGLNNDLPD